MNGAAVQRGLAAMAGALGGMPEEAGIPLKYAPVIHDARGEGAGDLPLAIELVYEGYLIHYRESRVACAGSPKERRLLAGDYFYAHGLRLVARAGDAEAVGLLTRLMAACSYLRAEGADWRLDDGLWELTAAAIAAAAGTLPRAAATRIFDRVDGAIAAGRPGDLQPLLAAGKALVSGGVTAKGGDPT